MKIFTFIKDHHTGLARGTITFIDNSLVYFFDKKPTRGPLFVNWVLSYQCNARCSFCNTNELNKTGSAAMTSEEALRVIRQIGEAGTWHLSLTGGDPLLRKDLGLIIAEAKRYGIYVNVNTNGFLLAGKAKMLVDSRIDSIIVSMDSDQPEIHDKIRGITGLTDAVIHGIETVRKLRSGRKPALTLRVVVSKQNYKSLGNIIETFKSKVDKIVFQPVHDGVNVPKFAKRGISANSSLFKVKDAGQYMLEASDRRLFAKIFNTLIKKHKWLNTLYHKEIETFFFDKDAMWDRYKCYAGYYYMAIDPSGSLSRCPFLHGSLGNVREHSMMDVWCGEEIKRWRKSLKNKENRCICWCGISEVNATLTNKFENKFVKLLAKMINRGITTIINK